MEVENYKNYQISVCENLIDVEALIRTKIQEHPNDDSFFIFNIDDLVLKYKSWIEKLPRVKPFYAVKCNHNDILLKTLATLGTGFDVASMGELKNMVDLGITPDRVIYANPTKQGSHLEFAKKHNYDRMTFDSVEELYKIKKIYPEARVVLRMKFDAKDVLACLGVKYGCDPIKEAPGLIEMCKTLDLNLIGVSFHVGSGCSYFPIFEEALQTVRKLFDYALTLGLNLNFVDIGGGFHGHDLSLLDHYGKYINKALDELFPGDFYEIISEPGRYFASSAFTLICNIHSKKVVRNDDGSIEKIFYFINDALYQSFMGTFLDNNPVIPRLMSEVQRDGPKYDSVVWGNTCDPVDKVSVGWFSEELDIGEYLIFDFLGDYSLALFTVFHGYTPKTIYPYVTKKNWYVAFTLTYNL